MAMQPDDFKRLRKSLSLTQQEMADCLGLSRKVVVEIEAGRAPIEKRTEIAAAHTTDQHTVLWNSSDERDGDIPLVEAQIVWDRDADLAPPLKVVTRGCDDPSYDCSFGACNVGWSDMSDAGRLAHLYAKMFEVMLLDKLAPKDIHDALSVIPEYRQSLPRVLHPND